MVRAGSGKPYPEDPEELRSLAVHTHHLPVSVPPVKRQGSPAVSGPEGHVPCAALCGGHPP